MMTAVDYFHLFNNTGLCGPLVSIGSVGTTYDVGLLRQGHGTTGTNLENACPTIAPTSSPTNPATATPTSSPTARPTSSPTATRSPTSNKPCCDTLRENPVWCCIEPTLSAAAVARACQEC